MKNFLFLIISLLSLLPSVVHSQYCGVATTNVAITPTTTNQVTTSYASGRRAFNFVATAGCTYYFETCGLSTADTYLRLYSTGTGGTVLATGDDNCGTQSSITWTCVTNGTYSVLLTNWSCANLTVATRVRYRITGCAPPPPVFNPCSSITNIADCGTTTNFTVSSGNGSYNPPATSCGFTTPGQERIYTFTPTVTTTYTINQNSSFGWIDWFFKPVSSGCNGTGWTCIDDLSGAMTSVSFTLTAGVQYYIMADPETTAGGNVSFSISCPPTYNPCASISNIPACGSNVLHNFSSGNGAYNPPATSCGFTTPGQEKIYTFTPTVTGTYAINQLSSFGWIDWFFKPVSGGCNLTGWTCIDDLSGAVSSVSFTMTAGVQYYIMADPETTTGGTIQFNLSCPTPPPANDNCINATTLTVLCPGITTTTSGTTLGATEDVIPDPSCDPGNIQDVWYSFNTGNNTQVDITAALGTATWIGMELYTSCGTLAVGPSVTCDFNILSPNPTTITGLSMNTTYRLRIFTNTSYDTPGSFTIRLNTINNVISLTSASSSQSVCVNNPITNITFTTTGATGATFSGLPSGVSGNWVNNAITISGTPTVAGTYNYTITMTGGCTGGVNTATGTITVNANNTISLSSSAGTNNQNICINTPIINITYNTTGATGATVSNLPSGVTGSWSSNTFTITGTPTVSGTFNYTITMTGGCTGGVNTATGTITVNADNTISLSSSASSQSVCINSPMTNITFATTGATGATFSGLPPGISGSWLNNVITISGTPTTSGSFNYTTTTTGGCSTASSFGVITVIDLVPTLSTITGNSTITPGTSETYSITPVSGTDYMWEYTESITAPLWNVVPGSNSPSVTFTWPPSTTDGAVRVTVSNNCNSESRLLLIITNTPLPIELYSFTGQPYNGQVILEWQTATEYNNNYFIIERSSNGFDWIKIKEVDAVGYSAELVKYLTFDEDAREGINYYKLSQVDFNGEIETFYPIAVKLQGTTECDYEFYNLSGQKIDIYYVPTGVYLKKCGDIVTKFLKL